MSTLAMSFEEALLRETVQADCLTVQDLYKSAFQAAMGCGHLIADEKAAFDRFMAEWQSAPDADVPAFTPLSEKFCRMHLAGMRKAGYAPEFCFELFKNSARIPGDGAKLVENADRVQMICGKLYGPAGKEEAEKAWQAWEKAGRPLFSHSQKYHAALQPHYRVVDAGCAEHTAVLYRLWQLQKQVLAGERRPAAVAIDGRCGAGKSTLAALFERVLNTPVAHMDDFFLPFSLRSPERLAQPGGNVHHERAQKQLLCHLGRGHAFGYPVFSCQTGGFEGLRLLPAAPVTVVEGSYSHHPAFGKVWDLKIFCNVEKSRQKERILARSGKEMWKNFEEKWIPMEEAYFAAFSVEEKSDIAVCPGA